MRAHTRSSPLGWCTKCLKLKTNDELVKLPQTHKNQSNLTLCLALRLIWLFIEFLRGFYFQFSLTFYWPFQYGYRQFAIYFLYSGKLNFRCDLCTFSSDKSRSCQIQRIISSAFLFVELNWSVNWNCVFSQQKTIPIEVTHIFFFRYLSLSLSHLFKSYLLNRCKLYELAFKLGRCWIMFTDTDERKSDNSDFSWCSLDQIHRNIFGMRLPWIIRCIAVLFNTQVNLNRIKYMAIWSVTLSVIKVQRGIEAFRVLECILAHSTCDSLCAWTCTNRLRRNVITSLECFCYSDVALRLHASMCSRTLPGKCCWLVFCLWFLRHAKDNAITNTQLFTL